MKKTIADENASKESRLKELNEFGKNKNETLQKRHNDKVDRLNKQIKSLDE